MPVTIPVVQWCARTLLVLSVVLGLGVSTLASAQADPGSAPGQNGQGNGPKGPRGADPAEEEVLIGSPGTHAAYDQYAYAFPEAPDCDESTLGNGGCVADNRGFFQGQCTSWVAHRLSQRNGISFSNWYNGRHWGDAVDWAKVAKSLGNKPDKTPSVGAVAWFKRGHVAYVEAINYDGSIVISEMNFDGHNGFRFSTVTPGYGWPDKFIHLADVIPYDATSPTTPGTPRVVTHRGRTGLAWSPSSDAFGVTGYRVLRNGVPLGATTSTRFWDHQVTAGQTYTYSVVAYDAAQNVSSPARVRVTPGHESVDRAWLTTDDGPALCGRSGSARRQGLGCTVLTDRGWRRVPLPRATRWGHAGSRAFLEDDGGVSYCRTVGSLSRPKAACTRLDTGTRSWSRDLVRHRPAPVRAHDASWVTTAEGPARCGRAGSERHPRVACSLLTDGTWRYTRATEDTPWGLDGTRAFVPAPDGSVSYCRTVGARPRARHLTCTPLDLGSRLWGYDRISGGHRTGLAADATWVDTAAGPALCTVAGRAGCRVLTRSGWARTELRPASRVGNPASRAFVATEDGGIAWCRTQGDPARRFRAACAVLDPDRLTWSRDHRSRPMRSTQVTDRTWVATPTGPALCGRSGSTGHQRIGCAVLDGDRWRLPSLGRGVRWGSADYRTFVPTADGVGYCRTIGRLRASCTTLDTARLRWSRDQGTRVTRIFRDPF